MTEALNDMISTSLQPITAFPDDWQRLPFDDFTTLQRGKDLTREQFRGGTIPVAGSNGRIGFHDTSNVSGPGVTVGRSGSVGRVSFYAEDFWAHNTALYVKNFHGNDPRFAGYFLESIELNRFGSGVSVPTLDRNVFRLLPVCVPPLTEQKRIAAVLGLVQRVVEQQERLLTLVAELKQTLLQHLFTHGLRSEPQRQTDIGMIPQSWEVISLRDCALVQTGVAKGRKLAGKETLTVPYLRVANVQSGYLDLNEMKMITIQAKEKLRYSLQKGDVVLTEGGDFDKLGRGFIWNGEIDDCVHQNHIFSVRVDRSRILPEFFAFLSQSPYGKAYFLSVAHKTTNLACINTTKLKAFPVLVPSAPEQREMVSVFETVDSKLNQTRRKLDALTSLFRTLLHQLMSAQIRVADLDIESILTQAITDSDATST